MWSANNKLKKIYIYHIAHLALIVPDNQAITISSYKTKENLQTLLFFVEDGEGRWAEA